jgi:two-component system cell cycle sensor histidine kinase/response regulator CckA
VAQEIKTGIDLLITDVVMPEMSGPDLAAQLTRLRPELVVLFISGYTTHALLHQNVLEAGTAFLHKLFRPTSLVSKVGDLIRGQPS